MKLGKGIKTYTIYLMSTSLTMFNKETKEFDTLFSAKTKNNDVCDYDYKEFE